ncbi:MAG: nucleoside phosphorylase [Candidatus Saccharicenans sp.]
MKKDISIVQPEISGLAIPQGKLIFIPFLPDSQLINEVKKRSRLKINLKPGQLFYLPDRAVLYGAVGAPACILALERVRLLRLKEILVLSYCGSLSSSLRIGQAFIPLKAWSDEGTSKHYVAKRKAIYRPSPDLVFSLKNFLNEHGLRFSSGPIVSTDAPFRETASWLKQMQEKGVKAVDMEISAVLSFSVFYGIKSAGLFIVSDELFSGRWVEASSSPEVKKAGQEYFLPLILTKFN